MSDFDEEMAEQGSRREAAMTDEEVLRALADCARGFADRVALLLEVMSAAVQVLSDRLEEAVRAKEDS